MKKKSVFFSIALIMVLLSNLMFQVTPAFAAASDKDITAFSLSTVAGISPVPSYVGVITGFNIAVTVPAGTNLSTTNFYATFTTTGASVKIGSTIQNSGALPTNKFISPKTYTVYDSLGGTQNYVVTVTVAPDLTAKDITAFSFASPAATGVISGTNITVNVPYGTNVTALVATFTHTGASIAVGATPQVSGVTANDFTSPVSYVVTDLNSATKTYIVTVNVDPGTAKAITSFTVPGQIGPATINEGAGTIEVTVPFSTDVTALAPTIVHTGASINPNSGVAQNFTSPVIYTVTALNASTKAYTVTVTIAAPTTTKAITSFSVPSQVGVVINEALHTITVTVPFGTNVTALVATFSHTGSSIAVGATSQVSGVTANNFTNPVTYTVTAQDASTQDYVVTIVANVTKDITSFNFTSPSAIGIISGTNIAVTVPFGTDVTALVATFAHNGTGVTVGATAQVSGTTPNNFTNPVVYTVTGLDASTKDYTVTVTIAANPAKDITAFSFTSPAAVGVITTNSIAVTVPFGTNVTALVATFTTTGTSVKVGLVTQVSGVTANNFTSPKVYTVTAADGTTKNYTVTVTIASGPPTITASGAATVVPGSQYTYTFNYTSDAAYTGAQATFTLPAHTTYVSDSGTFCGQASGIVTCNLGTINGPGGSFTVTIAVDKLKKIDTALTLNSTSYSISGGGISLTSGTATVTATTSTPFADVPAGYWALDSIQAIWSAGITGGCIASPLTYCPEATVTRAEMAIFLLKGIHGSSYSPPAVGATTGFADVATDFWAAAWIKQLAAESITSGCGNGNYCPNASATRAQMAIFLLKAKHGAAYIPPAATGVFTDVATDYWAATWIERLATEGITSGCGTGIYCPESSVTRAQMAIFIQRTFAGSVLLPTP